MSGNGKAAVAEEQMTGTVRWEPESPFLSDVRSVSGLTEAAMTASQVFAPEAQGYSPFVADYEDEGGDSGGPRAERFAELVSELGDTEFSEALEDLVNEATAIAEDRYRVSSEAGDPAMEQLGAEQAVQSYLEPIAQTAESMLEGMADRLEGMDVASAAEDEVESLMEQFTVPAHDLSPVADQFLGGLLKKAKRLAGKVMSVMPQAIIIRKLAKLVRPLLNRVLTTAIKRLPVAVRPMAQNLAKRFLGTALAGAPLGEMNEEEESGELASVDPAQLEEEFDSEIAGYVMDREAFENEAAVEHALSEELTPRFDQLRHLAHARKRFAKRIVEMRPDEPVEPAVEEFVPAILAALKLGVKLIGRPKIVSALSGFVASFIKRYVGPEQAKALSRPLVDAGLRLVGLEVSQESDQESAGYAIGATVEDTIARLVQDTPEAAWESEPLLHAYALEAFQEAASAHFPDSHIRTDLHESSKTSGVWVGLPRASAHKSYKKYSRVIDITITPQGARATTTFGGIPLRAFLADRLGVKVDRPVQARAHLYEAIPGTSLGLIALGESNVPLLGSAGRTGRSLIHPLTAEAATTLIGEPRLGRPVDQQFLARRGRISVGQRFYFLEIDDARLRQARRPTLSGTRPARSSQPKIVLDFPKRELRLFLFFSEADAQQVAAQLRKKASPTAVISLLKTLHETMIRRALSTHPAGVVKIIHEAAPTEQLAMPMTASVVRLLGSRLANRVRDWVATVLSKELTQNYERITGDFVRAASNDADGVTLQITLEAPPILQQLRKALRGGLAAVPRLLRAFGKDTLGSYRFEMRPGFGVR
jgi:hypothetical protein